MARTALGTVARASCPCVAGPSWPWPPRVTTGGPPAGRMAGTARPRPETTFAHARRRGSVLLLVVGLLTIIAMLGGTFLLVARMNQRTSRALCESAPPDAVAEGILQRLLAERARDLYFDAAGTVVYGAIQTPEDAIDYPAEWALNPQGGTMRYDRALANIEPEPYPVGGGAALRWRHLSNLPGSSLRNAAGVSVPFSVAQIQEVEGATIENPANPEYNEYVDTDGYAYERNFNGNTTIEPLLGERLERDARLFDSGVFDRRGNQYRVAVRLIDASGLVNFNTAGLPLDADTPINPADVSQGFRPMPAVSVSLLQRLYSAYLDSGLPHVNAVTAATAAANNLHATRVGGAGPSLDTYDRNYVVRPLNPQADPLPFDAGDALAMLWRSADGLSAAGRVIAEIADAAEAAAGPAARDPAVLHRAMLTTWSASRVVSPRFDTGTIAQEQKFDLNIPAANAQKNVWLWVLSRAFYKTVPVNLPVLTQGADPRFDGTVPERMDKERWLLASQLAANLWDYVDADDDPTVLPVLDGNGSPIVKANTQPAVVYGVERQLFITEIAYHAEDNAGTTDLYFAIELFNPYDTMIRGADYVLQVDNFDLPLTLLDVPPRNPAVPDSGHLVVISRTGILAVGLVQEAAFASMSSSVRLKKRVGTDQILLDEFACNWTQDPATLPIPLPVSPVGEALRRGGENPCIYPLPVTATLPTCNLKQPPSDVSPNPVNNLGYLNPDPLIAGFSCPVFIRNNRMVNVAELDRLFHVGPSREDPSDMYATAFTVAIQNDFYAGRLTNVSPVAPRNPPTTDISPLVPVGGLWSECFMVGSPGFDDIDNDGDGTPDDMLNNPEEGVVYGRINVNTATFDALRSLPGLAGLGMNPNGTLKDPVADPDGPAARDAIAREIIAYRDRLDNDVIIPGADGTGGGRQYETLGRPQCIGLPLFAALRDEPGLAAGGEIALPIDRRGRTLVGNSYSLPVDQLNEYGPMVPAGMGRNLAPYPYLLGIAGAVVTNTDDGLQPMLGDLTKSSIYYAWLSNQITVRSDTYIAYIYVENPKRDPTDPNEPVRFRRYVALIDRSRCWQATDQPRVLFFSQIK